MIVVTTPTGRIGRQLLDLLLAAGEPVRVIARDPSRLPAGVRERAEVVRGSHGDPDVVGPALTGADAVFWVVPPNFRAASMDAAFLDFTRPACEVFATGKVGRVVGVSALGRGVTVYAGLVTASLAMDDLIAGTGVPYRALALPTFIDNVLDQVDSIRDDGVFALPLSGDRAFPACATRDIAATAARLLRDPSWSGHGSVPVLGPEDISPERMARIMTEVLGRPVRFQRIPMDVITARLTEHGASAAMTRGMADMMAAMENGLTNAEPRTARATTPTGFRRWCEEVLRPAVLAP